MDSHRIIVVEDKAIIALDIAKFLITRGYQNTSYFLNGKEALKAIGDNKPDLALLDVILQGDISGIDIAARLKDQAIPFIFISALSNMEHQNAVTKLGPRAIFLKPVNLNDVLITIGDIFAKDKSERPKIS